MKKQWTLSLFAILVSAQIAVPAMMILAREKALSEGEIFRFRTAPVDPYDAFRGRYMRLRVEAENRPLPLGEIDEAGARRGSSIYVELDRNPRGFAEFSRLRLDRPAGTAYLEARVARVESHRIYVDVPLDRFYLPENLAPRAEAAYALHSGGTEHDAYILVRVRDGFPVIEDLYLGGVPISEYLEKIDR